MVIRLLLVILLSTMAFLGLAVSAIALAFGLMRKRRRVWITAMVTASLSIAVGLLVASWVACKSFQRAKRFAEWASTPEPEPDETELQAWVRAPLGYDLPEGIRCLRGRCEESAFPPVRTWYVIMEVEPSARDRVRQWLTGPEFTSMEWTSTEEPTRVSPPRQKWQRGSPPWPFSQMREGKYYGLINRGRYPIVDLWLGSVESFDVMHELLRNAIMRQKGRRTKATPTLVETR